MTAYSNPESVYAPLFVNSQTPLPAPMFVKLQSFNWFPNFKAQRMNDRPVAVTVQSFDQRGSGSHQRRPPLSTTTNYNETNQRICYDKFNDLLNGQDKTFSNTRIHPQSVKERTRRRPPSPWRFKKHSCGHVLSKSTASIWRRRRRLLSRSRGAVPRLWNKKSELKEKYNISMSQSSDVLKCQ